MAVRFDVEALNRYIKDIYLSVGIRVSIFDADFNSVIEYPAELSPLCTALRTCPNGTEACRSCDIAACKRAQALQKSHRYLCHAGLTEVIMPIRMENSIVGYAIFAHLIARDDPDAVERIIRLVGRFGLSREEILEALSGMETYSNEKIDASVRLLEAFVSYLELKQMLGVSEGDFKSRVDALITDSLGQNLDSNYFCDTLGISRTQLYKLCRRHLGCGISEYVLSRRMDEAKRLLKAPSGTELGGVADIAHQCGFSDYNYFCKVFHAKVGMSPTEYRKRRQNL